VTAETDQEPQQDVPPPSRRGTAAAWLTTTDHKRIALLTLGTALVFFVISGVLALVIRAQLTLPDQRLVTNDLYNGLFTIHGSGMIYLVLTPVAIALGLYLVPLQIGAPAVAAPRLAMTGFWLYLAGAVLIFSGFVSALGPAAGGWYSYPPLASGRYTPGAGETLWIAGVFVAVVGMILQAGTVLWTALLKRARPVTLLRMPVFTWSTVATNLMVIGSFPSLLAAMALLAWGRAFPDLFDQNLWNIAYQHLFWFFAHPVVYVMFFPFVGVVAEVLSTFSGRRFFGYRGTVVSLLVFAAFSMSVWGHHMFSTGQASNDYYSLTSILLLVPAGVEYFGFLATVVGGRLRFTVPMLFAVAFVPQFLVGGLTGIMVATPVIDYQVTDSYFIVAHWHYTLAAGSLFGMFAAFYFWFPKATGLLLDERLGRWHFWLLVVGTNATFLPMFWLGLHGMPRRIATYLPQDGFTTANIIATVGSAFIALSMIVAIANVVTSVRDRRRPAGDDPWQGLTLEWATASPPAPTNFDEAHPLPPVRSFTPLLDERDRESAEGTGDDPAGHGGMRTGASS
jgi:cytochrome c oxidase subunit 1